MISSPAISVIVPIYNTKRYLCECINSILIQTFRDFELILVDDGSTDGSSDICDKYVQADSRLKVFHKKNAGVTSARRLGVEKSRGEWISFVDSDDMLKVNALELMYSAIDNVDVVITSIDHECKDECYCADEFIRKTLRCEIARGLPGRLFNKRMFLKDCWPPSYITIGEDELVNLKLASLGNPSVKSINNNIYIYRHNLESVTATRKFSIDYEEMLMCEYEKILEPNIVKFYNDYEYKKLLTLENLIVCKIFVDYKRAWIKELMCWGKGNQLSFRHWCVLNIRNNLLCKYILAIEKRIKYLLNVFSV